MFDEEALKEKVAGICEKKNVMLEHLYHKPLLKPEEIFEELMSYKKMLEPYVCDVSLFLWNALKEGKEILLEGQLGSLKDPDHGIYPMVTSSSTLAGYGAVEQVYRHMRSRKLSLYVKHTQRSRSRSIRIRDLRR